MIGKCIAYIEKEIFEIFLNIDVRKLENLKKLLDLKINMHKEKDNPKNKSLQNVFDNLDIYIIKIKDIIIKYLKNKLYFRFEKKTQNPPDNHIMKYCK